MTSARKILDRPNPYPKASIEYFLRETEKRVVMRELERQAKREARATRAQADHRHARFERGQPWSPFRDLVNEMRREQGKMSGIFRMLFGLSYR